MCERLKVNQTSDVGKFYVYGFPFSLVAMILGWSIIPPEPRAGLMQTDPTEAGDFHHPVDEGFTQAWDTVGAGAHPSPRQRELS